MLGSRSWDRRVPLTHLPQPIPVQSHCGRRGAHTCTLHETRKHLIHSGTMPCNRHVQPHHCPGGKITTCSYHTGANRSKCTLTLPLQIAAYITIFCCIVNPSATCKYQRKIVHRPTQGWTNPRSQVAQVSGNLLTYPCYGLFSNRFLPGLTRHSAGPQSNRSY